VPEVAREPGRQLADALRVLVRVVVAVLGGERQPAQRVERRLLVVAPPRDRLLLLFSIVLFLRL
jgi:hypothetical protein